MALRETLNRLYWSLERLIDPGVPSSQVRYAETLRSVLKPGMDWLDLGCGHSILPYWIDGQEELVARAKSLIGYDYDWASLLKHRQISRLVSGDIVNLPFRENAFDLITANMVVEHLTDPAQSLAEVRRILRPGGRFLYHTPNRRYYMTAVARMVNQDLKNKIVWIMERRAEDDVFPTFYRMNTEEDIQSAARAAGLQVETLLAINTSSTGQILLGPFVLADLAWRRATRADGLRQFRSNYVVVLRKP